MNRRRYLSVAAATLVGGCLGGAPANSDPSESAGDTTDPPSDTPTPTATVTPHPQPRPEIRDSAFESDPCPSVGSETTCYHAFDAGAEPETVYLVPASESLERPSASTAFTLYNGADRGFGMNPYEWRLMKRVEGGWRHVAPWMVVQPWTTVPPGGRHEWWFGFGDATPDGSSDTEAGAPALGPGVFAFSVGGTLGDEHRTALSLFEVTGPGLTLAVDDDVESTREGAVVTLSTPAYADAAEDDRRTVTLRRLPDAGDVAPVLAEHAVQSVVLRNGLAAFGDDVDEVRVRANRSEAAAATTRLAAAYRDPTTDSEAPPESDRRFRYGDVAFEASTA